MIANRYPKRNDQLYDDISLDETAFPIHPASSPSPPPFVTNVGDFRSQSSPNNLSFYETNMYGQQAINGNMNLNPNLEDTNYGGQNFGTFNLGDIINNPAAGYVVGMGLNQMTQSVRSGVGLLIFNSIN